MIQSIVHIALVVRDYDEAIDFYTNKLNVILIEDSYQPVQSFGNYLFLNIREDRKWRGI